MRFVPLPAPVLILCLTGSLFAQAPDTVFLEDLTWTEVRDKLAAGVTTVNHPDRRHRARTGRTWCWASTTTWSGTRRARRRGGSATRWWRR